MTVNARKTSPRMWGGLRTALQRWQGLQAPSPSTGGRYPLNVTAWAARLASRKPESGEVCTCFGTGSVPDPLPR